MTGANELLMGHVKSDQTHQLIGEQVIKREIMTKKKKKSMYLYTYMYTQCVCMSEMQSAGH